MTEPKRATWREFVEWLRRKRSDKDGELRRAAPEVQTRGEAALVCRYVLEAGPTTTGRLIDEWFAALRSQGVEPPADPPSVAEVLNRLSYEFDACESDAASASSSLAWKTAAKMARSKAKEFT
jgi:hypothetical protein